VTPILIAAGALVAVVAAARSTWSPCGVSMLATITPLAESARGHRYRSTARWFVAGAVAGGLTLGLVLGVVALGVGAAGLGTGTLAVLACLASVVAAASDARVGGFALPVHHRQVNERWLDQFRPWVYGAGFGWQIGTGFVTYIKTAGVYLVALLAVLTGSWRAAVLLGTLFGLVRGLAVYLGRTITTPAQLADFHRRFVRLGVVVLAVVIATECAGATLFGWLASPWAGAAVLLLVAAVCGTRVLRRRARPARPAGAGARAELADAPAARS